MREAKAGKAADKWKVFRDASAAFERLGIQSNSLAVFEALLSFYPEAEVRQGADDRVPIERVCETLFRAAEVATKS